MDIGSFKSEISMINYNGDLISSDSATSVFFNRGFQYGDGIFETMIIEKGKLKFQNEHWERISEGIEVLRLEQPFTKDQFLSMQSNLLKACKLEGQYARMKLYIWRKTGGLYTPTNSKADFLFTVEKTKKKEVQELKKVGVAKTVHLHKTAFSHLKTISALPYVMAGIEKQERDLEELVLLNQEGFMAETTASNICFFDVKQRTIHTPSLESGCINGVSRRYLFKNAHQYDLTMREVMWRPEELNSDLAVFSFNVAGLNQLLKIENHEMSKNHEGAILLKEVFN